MATLVIPTRLARSTSLRSHDPAPRLPAFLPCLPAAAKRHNPSMIPHFSRQQRCVLQLLSWIWIYRQGIITVGFYGMIAEVYSSGKWKSPTSFYNSLESSDDHGIIGAVFFWDDGGGVFIRKVKVADLKVSSQVTTNPLPIQVQRSGPPHTAADLWTSSPLFKVRLLQDGPAAAPPPPSLCCSCAFTTAGQDDEADHPG